MHTTSTVGAEVAERIRRGPKRGTRGLLAAAIAGGLVLSACSSASEAEDGPTGDAAATTTADAGGDVESTTLRVSQFLPESVPPSLAMEAMAEKITEQTDGAVQFEFFYNGTLCTADIASDCVTDGRADIAMTAPDFYPAVFPITGIGVTGYDTIDTQAAGDALMRMYEEWPEVRGEYEAVDQRVLFFGGSEMPALATGDQVTSLDQIAGKSIRATGGARLFLVDAGADPVQLSSAELYESLERGVIDGAISTLSALGGGGVPEVAPYMFDLGAVVGQYSMVSVVMNQAVYNGLDPAIQEVFDSVAAEIQTTYDEYNQVSYDATCETLVDTGAELFVPEEDAELEAMVERLRSAAKDEWLQNVEGLLDDPEALWDAHTAAIGELSRPREELSLTMDYCLENYPL